MQSHQDRHDYPTVNDPSFQSTAQSGHSAGTAVSVLEPYVPPNVPHGLPHVVRFATLSSMDLPLEVRFLIIMIARFADVHGVASVANSTLGEICRIGSHHTVERWISLASDVGILRKEPGKGGKNRKIQQLHVPGRGQGLGATASGPAGHQPHRPTFQQTPIPFRPTTPVLPRRDGHSTKGLQHLQHSSRAHRTV